MHARTIGNLVPGNLVRGLVSTQGAWYGPGMLKGLPGLRLPLVLYIRLFIAEKG